MARQFEQKVYTDADNTKVVAIAQTRDGIDEWITPIVTYERDKATGIYFPPGLLSDRDVTPQRVRQVHETLSAKSFEQLSVNGLTHLSPNFYNGAVVAQIEVRDAQISYRIDGGAPTADIGHYLNEGDILKLSSLNDIERFTAININSKATIAVTYFSDVI